MSPAPHFLLAAPSRRALLRRRQVAEILGLTVSALEKWAEKGTGPRFYRRGFSPRSPALYRIEDLEHYVRDQGGEEVLATLVTGW
jgi:hypothetical protein